MIAYIQKSRLRKGISGFARRQCRYPGIPPQYAVKYKTPMIRMKRLSVFSKKEMPVFPRPWIMLMSALLAYKNGHIQERVRMNSPARELWKSSLPNTGPSRKESGQASSSKKKCNHRGNFESFSLCVVRFFESGLL